MSRTTKLGGVLLTATALASGLLASHPASAQDAAKLEAIQQQIQALQAELKRIRSEMAQRDAQVKAAREEAAKARADAAQAAAARPAPAAPAAATAAATAPAATGPVITLGSVGPAPSMQGVSPPVISGTTVDRPNPTFQLGGVRVTLGGFVDLTGIYRSANEFRGRSTGFNSIPFNNDPNAHMSEFRMTAQETRLSSLIQGKPTSDSTLAAYIESDFNNCSGGCNSVQSNSYTPRLRQGYAQYDNNTWGFHVLAGQAWSLITPFTVGITPRKENIPLTLDSQYVVGFSWTRNAQLRVAKDFDNKYWIAASLESPQAVFTNVTTPLPAGTPNAGDTVTFQGAGNGGLNPQANYSIDVAPDIILKAAADPGWGHSEIYGVGRFFKNRVSSLGNGSTNITFGGGGGVGAILPVWKNYVDLTGNVLYGWGIGRYGSSGLPDVTIKSDGSIAPLQSVQAWGGLVGHPTPEWDVYAYGGTEQIGRKSFVAKGAGFGYGSDLVNNTGCNIELGTCNAQTSQLIEATLGYWWRFMHGNYGTFMTGFQYAWIVRDAFRGKGGAPSNTENVVMANLRYLPFQ